MAGTKCNATHNTAPHSTIHTNASDHHDEMVEMHDHVLKNRKSFGNANIFSSLLLKNTPHRLHENSILQCVRFN